jgi:hypothetical protein
MLSASEDWVGGSVHGQDPGCSLRNLPMLSDIDGGISAPWLRKWPIVSSSDHPSALTMERIVAERSEAD